MRYLLFITLFVGFCTVAYGQDTVKTTPKPQTVTASPPPTTNTPTERSDNNTIYEFVDQQPEFPGGYEAFGEYITAHIKYPDKAIKKGIEGTVYLRAIIDTDGSIYNVQVLKAVPGLTEAAVEVLKIHPGGYPVNKADSR